MNPAYFGYPRCKHFTRYVFYLVVLALLPATAASIFAVDLTRVHVLEKVQIDKENILLRHIAKINGSDPHMVRKLSGIAAERSKVA